MPHGALVIWSLQLVRWWGISSHDVHALSITSGPFSTPASEFPGGVKSFESNELYDQGRIETESIHLRSYYNVCVNITGS